MEQLSIVLQPYKTIVERTASILTILQIFSGVFVCFDFRKRNSTSGYSVAPFLGGLVFSILNLQYGKLLNDSAMINVNIVGLTLSLIYTTVFLIYTPTHEKSALFKQFAYASAFTFSVLTYVQYEEPKDVQHRFGLILTIVLILLISAPLFSLGDIIRNKSTEGLPFPIIFSGTLVAFSWLVYGIILNNGFIVFQNVFGLTLSAIQLSLFAIYPSKRAQVDTKKKN